MLWVVQDDMFQENRRYELLGILHRFGIPYQRVKVSNNKALPDVQYDGNIITNGSIMLSKIALQRGWKPGSLLNDNFSYEVWHPHFKDFMLNGDVVFTSLRDAFPETDRVFVRPVLDDKGFTGKVFELEEFYKWKATTHVQWDTRIIYSSVKNIGAEYRHYIVNGEVVTSSRYKLGTAANQSADVDDYIVKFAQDMVGIWQPAKAFVLDTFVSDQGIGIIEMGCICHAGLYQADIQKIVMALEDME